MSISGISSNSYNPYQTGANPLQQQFQQLGQALQSGNLSAAQSDFASLRAGFSQPSSTTGASSATSTSSTTSNPVNQAFNQLASDLQSGNLSAAQKDYSAIQQETKTPMWFSGPQSIDPNHLGGKGGDYLRPVSYTHLLPGGQAGLYESPGISVCSRSTATYAQTNGRLREASQGNRHQLHRIVLRIGGDARARNGKSIRQAARGEQDLEEGRREAHVGV